MRPVVPALLATLIAGAALAQQPPAPAQAPAQPQPPAPAPVTEESIERGLVNLGLMAGHAFQCTSEADRPAMQRMLLEYNAILVAEMGANAAFRWVTAFGAGSAAEVDRSYCDRSLADWQRHATRHRLGR